MLSGPGLNSPSTISVLIWALPPLRMYIGPAVIPAFSENPKVAPGTSARVVHILPCAYRLPHSSGPFALVAFPPGERKHKAVF